MGKICKWGVVIFGMTKKQYYCDDLLEYRDYAIFDLSKADKNIEDFKDEDGDSVLWEFDNYLVDETNSILNGEEVCELLNELSEENKELKQLIKKVIDERFVSYPLLCKLKEMVKE